MCYDLCPEEYLHRNLEEQGKLGVHCLLKCVLAIFTQTGHNGRSEYEPEVVGKPTH